MTRLILVRHAQSAPDKAQPEEAWPLSEKGRAQADALVSVLQDAGVDALASSPYIRAQDTLRPFAKTRGLDIHIDEDLRERRLTRQWFENLEAVNAAIKRMHADLDFAYPDGESGHQCLARYSSALTRVLDRHPGKCVAVGSHGGVIGHLLASLHDDLPEDFWLSIRNPHLFHFEWDGKLHWTGETTIAGEQTIGNW